MQKIETSASNFMHLARWVAAGLVLIGHLRSLLFVDYSQVISPSLLLRAFYFITGFGHEAVMVFFVLSGFLVGGRVFQEVQTTGTFEWRAYLIKRFTRLYAVFLFALLLGALLDGVGAMVDTYGLYTYATPTPIYVVNSSFMDTYTLPIWLGNLVMLATIVVPIFGSNAPIWSLIFEFWYYLVAPCFALLLFARDSRLRIIGGLVGVGIGLWLGWGIMGGFLIWLMGAVLVYTKRAFFPAWWIPAGLFAVAMVAKRLGYLPDSISDYVIGFTFALVLNEILYGKKPFFLQYGLRFNYTLADFSYSLYLLHFPMMIFITALVIRFFNYGVQMQPTWVNLAYYGGVVLFLYGYAYVGSLLTEKNTARFRDYLMARLLVRPSSSAVMSPLHNDKSAPP